MFAQVVQVLYANGTFRLRINQNGWLSQIFIYMLRALKSTLTGNPNNEYIQRLR